MAFRYIAFIKVIYENHLVPFSIVGVHESALMVSLGYIWGFVCVNWGLHWGVLWYH